MDGAAAVEGVVIPLIRPLRIRGESTQVPKLSKAGGLDSGVESWAEPLPGMLLEVVGIGRLSLHQGINHGLVEVVTVVVGGAATNQHGRVHQARGRPREQGMRAQVSGRHPGGSE